MSDPVYLVSRCATIDEFVQAFRRYVDRLGVFVPATTPVGVGRRGRFAITLRDGGIVIDGEAEVIMSSARPSGLHGRPGMTLRFATVDAASRAVLDHLEKVRFTAKNTAAADHLVARPGPAVPDPGPPAPAKPGVDGAQQLAECVVVGDAIGERARSAGSVPPPIGATASGKFAIPTITPRGAAASGPVAASGPTTTNAPPPVGPPTRESAAPPRLPTASGAVPPPSARVMQAHRPTMIGPAVDPRAPSAMPSGSSGGADAIPTAASVSAAVTVAGGAATVPTALPTQPPMSSPPTLPEAVPIETPWLRHTTRGVAPPGVHEELTPSIAIGLGAATITATIPVAAPPPTPPEPPPPESELAEPPPPPARRPPPPKTKTMMGLGAILRGPASPSSPGVLIPPELLDPTAPPPGGLEPADSARPTARSEISELTPGMVPPRGGSIEIDPSLLEPTDVQPAIDPLKEPTPSGPASVIVDLGSTPLPDPAAPIPPLVAAPPLVPAPPILPGMPGWVPPAPPGRGAALPPPAIEPVSPAPHARPPTDGGTGFFSDTGQQARFGYTTENFFRAGSEPASPVGYVSEDMTALVQASPRQKRMLVIILSCLGVFVIGFVAILVIGGKDKPSRKPAPVARGSGPALPGAGSAASPVPPAQSGSGSDATQGSGATPGTPGSQGSGATPGTPGTPGSGATPGTPGTPGSPGSQGSGATPGTPGSGATPGSASDQAGAGSAGDPAGAGSNQRVAMAPTAGACTVRVTSSPSGSDVVVGGKVRGHTPLELHLPCATTQIAVRRTRYTTWTRTVKPTAKALKVNARLERPMFTVKVSSVPSGATVAVGGRKAGRTPTAVKVPGYEPTTITLSKDGYASASEKVTAKQSGTAIKMTLKKK